MICVNYVYISLMTALSVAHKSIKKIKTKGVSMGQRHRRYLENLSDEFKGCGNQVTRIEPKPENSILLYKKIPFSKGKYVDFDEILEGFENSKYNNTSFPLERRLILYISASDGMNLMIADSEEIEPLMEYYIFNFNKEN